MSSVCFEHGCVLLFVWVCVGVDSVVVLLGMGQGSCSVGDGAG